MSAETRKCARCDGCGQVANSESGEPWTAWSSLPPADRDRKAADYDRLAAENERLRTGLSEAAGRAEEICDHGFALLTDTDATDLEGMLSALAEEAREVAGGDKPHMLHLADDEIVRLRAGNDRLASENEALRRDAAFWREIVATFWKFAGVADAPEGEPWKVNETNSRLYALRSERDAATARVVALEASLESLLEVSVYPPEPECECHINPPCNDCVEWGGLRDAFAAVKAALAATPPADLTQHPAYRAGWRVSESATGLGKRGEAQAQHAVLLDPEGRIVAKLAPSRRSQLEWLATLANNTTPPADLTQHPAYRAGRRAGIEEAVGIVDSEPDPGDSGDVAPLGLLAMTRAHPAEALLTTVRCTKKNIAARLAALLDTKEMRDGE